MLNIEDLVQCWSLNVEFDWFELERDDDFEGDSVLPVVEIEIVSTLNEEWKRTFYEAGRCTGVVYDLIQRMNLNWKKS